MTAGYEIRADLLSQLRSRHTQALGILAHSSVDDAISSAAKGQLGMVGTYIARLSPSGDLGLKVASGALTHAKWMAIARLQWDQVSYTLQQLGMGALTWSKFWDEVVVQTGRDVAGAVSKPEIYGVLVLVAVIVVALVVLRVT